MMALAAEAQRLLLLAHRQVLRSSRDEMGDGSSVGVGQAFDLHARQGGGGGAAANCYHFRVVAVACQRYLPPFSVCKPQIFFF